MLKKSPSPYMLFFSFFFFKHVVELNVLVITLKTPTNDDVRESKAAESAARCCDVITQRLCFESEASQRGAAAKCLIQGK